LVTEGTPVNADIFLLYENGIARIALVVAVVLTMIYYFDLYDAFVLTNRREAFTRLVGVLGCTLLALGFLYYTGSSSWRHCALGRNPAGVRSIACMARVFFRLVSRIYGLIPVQEGVPTCDKGLFP